MIALLICILTALAVLVYWIREAIDDGELFPVFAGLILGGLTLCGTGLFFAAISVAVPHHFTTERVSLAVLQDGTNVTGHFYLTSGVIDSKPTYTFYTKTGDAYKLENAEASKVVVYQDVATPYLIRQTGCHTEVEWIFFCVTDGRVTEIHVPAGTIKTNLVLDAKQ